MHATLLTQAMVWLTAGALLSMWLMRRHKRKSVR